MLWYPEHGIDDSLSEGKGIQVADIQDLRLGTEVDPTVIDSHVTLPSNQKPVAPTALGRNLFKKTTNVFSSLFTKAETQNNAPDAMYGSAVLRRNCTAEELALSFSLVLQDRYFINSFDKVIAVLYFMVFNNILQNIGHSMPEQG